jgi:hypothetical protein
VFYKLGAVCLNGKSLVRGPARVNNAALVLQYRPGCLNPGAVSHVSEPQGRGARTLGVRHIPARPASHRPPLPTSGPPPPAPPPLAIKALSTEASSLLFLNTEDHRHDHSPLVSHRLHPPFVDSFRSEHH